MPIKLDSLFPGAILHYFNEIDSTNHFAKHLLSKSQPAEGTLIISDFQTQGRGQYGRDWLSVSTKNLLFSIILKPAFISIPRQFEISQLVATSLCLALLQRLKPTKVSVKWPNDLIVNDHKIAGILIQNQIQGSFMQSSVIGIGINVNQMGFPDGFVATSMKMVTGSETDKYDFLNDFLKIFQKRYQTFRTFSDSSKLLDEYNALLYRRGKKISFVINNVIKEGIVEKVDSSGNLHVSEMNQTKTYKFGEIKWKL